MGGHGLLDAVELDQDGALMKSGLRGVYGQSPGQDRPPAAAIAGPLSLA